MMLTTNLLLNNLLSYYYKSTLLVLFFIYGRSLMHLERNLFGGALSLISQLVGVCHVHYIVTGMILYFYIFWWSVPFCYDILFIFDHYQSPVKIKYDVLPENMHHSLVVYLHKYCLYQKPQRRFLPVFGGEWFCRNRRLWCCKAIHYCFFRSFQWRTKVFCIYPKQRFEIIITVFWVISWYVC